MTLKVQTCLHIEVDALPKDIQAVVSVLCLELSIPTWKGSVMRWAVSSQQFDVCPSDIDFDTAANAINHYLTKVSGRIFDDGTILYIDL
jgi:hypothetical protein